MAYIRDFAFTEGTTASATPACEMPVHQSGDLLLAFANADAVTVNASSGWTSVTNVSGSGHSSRVMYKVAASSSETLTLSLSASDTYTCTVVAIIGADNADPINGFANRTSDDATVPFAGIGMTTDEDNCLVFSFLSTDGGLGPTCEPGWVNLTTEDAGANSGGLAYSFKKGAGAVAASNWWGITADNTTATIVAINDSGTFDFCPPYIEPGDSPGAFLEPGYWITAGGANAWGNVFPTSLTLGTIGSKNTVFDAAAVLADTGINPYWASANCTPAQDATGAAVSGPQVNFASAQDMSGKILLWSFLFTTPRDYVDISTPTDSGQAGMLFVVRDGTAYKAWSVAAKNTVTTTADARNIIAIQVDQTTDTRFASSGTVVDTAIDGFLTLAQNRYGAVAFLWSCVFLADEFTIQGGTAGTTLDFDDLFFLLTRSLGKFPVMIREGSAATFLAPLKFGGGDPIHIAVSLRTLQFRKQSDDLNYLDWHVDDNRVGFEFDGQADDTIHFTDSVFTAESAYYWRFNSGFDADCDHNFSGTTVVNATVTLRSTVTLVDMSFINCGSFIQNNASVSDSVFEDTLVTSDNPADISGCAFTSGGTGHAIEITTAGTYSFVGNTFSGYGADGTTDAAVYNNSGGAVTLNVTGGGVPTVRNGAGASTTVNATVTVTFTGLVAGTEIRVFETSGGAEVAGTESTAGTTFAADLEVSTSYFVAVLAVGYLYVRRTGLTFTASQDFPINLAVDANYRNP